MTINPSNNKLTETRFMDVRLRLLEYATNCSLEELLQKTLDELEVLTQSSIGFYHFVDKDQNSIILQSWSTRTVNEFCKAERKGIHYRIDQAGVWVDCVHQRKPVIHNNYTSLPHRKGLPQGHATIVRELVVPIIRDNCIVAIIGVGNKSNDYSQADIEIVSFLADVAWEIVKRKRMEEALQRAYESLEKKVIERTAELEWRNRELQEFASVASHDLQEPLRKIKILGELVEQELSGSVNDKGRDYLRRMTNAADRMQKLVKALLSYSHMSSKNVPYERIDLKLIVDRVVNDLSPAWELKPMIEIVDLPEIDADPVQMTLLFQNLLVNAVRYRKEDRVLIVKISGSTISRPDDGRKNKSCELRVEDNGIGFDMRYVDKIFLPFERLHGRGEYEGTGMGLAICRKIAERHGGEITAHSTPGEGSTFIVTLPMRQTSE